MSIHLPMPDLVRTVGWRTSFFQGQAFINADYPGSITFLTYFPWVKGKVLDFPGVGSNLHGFSGIEHKFYGSSRCFDKK